MQSGIVGTMFRAARLGKGLTQAQVAEQVNLMANAYGKIELGRNGVQADLIGPLCRVLGIPVTDVLMVLSGGVMVPCSGCDDTDMAGAATGAGAYRLFDTDEWEMHRSIAAFAGMDVWSDGAIRLSSPVITEHRLSVYRHLHIRKEGLLDGKRDYEAGNGRAYDEEPAKECNGNRTCAPY